MEKAGSVIAEDISSELSTNELARRLKILMNSLQEVEQRPETAAKYSDMALKLAEEAFTGHNSREIRILVACCIADILRIYAPEVPYGDPVTVKGLLIFLAKQLRGLENPKDPLYPRFYYLLENLSVVRSLMLAHEFADCDDIVGMLIKNILGSINSAEQEEALGAFALDLIGPMIKEIEGMSSWRILDALLLPLTLNNKVKNSRAAKVTEKIIQHCESILEPSIQSFFTQALSSADPLENSELSHHVCEIFFEMYKICPDVMLPALPQLENRLQITDEGLRMDALKLVVKLLRDEETGLGDGNSSLFEAFISRFTDIKPEIRILCAKSVVELIQVHEHMTDSLLVELNSRTLDLDENVRKEAVAVITQILKKSFATAPNDLLNALMDRVRDKKFIVRKEAMLGLATVYRKIVMKEDGIPDLKKRVLLFRSCILKQYWNKSMDDKLLCEKLFHTCLVPYQLGSEQRMQMLYQAYCQLDDGGSRSSLRAVQGIIHDQANVRKTVRQILELHKQEETESRRNKIQYVLRKLSVDLVDPHRSHEDLKRFYQMLSEDNEAFEIMEHIMGRHYTTKDIERSVREMLKKLGPDSVYCNVKGTVTSLLERVAPLMMDVEAMEELMVYVAEVVSGVSNSKDMDLELNQERGLGLITLLTKPFPHCFLSDVILHHVLDFLRLGHSLAAEVALGIFDELGRTDQFDKAQFPGIYKMLLPLLEANAKGGTPHLVKCAIKCINNVVKDHKTKIDLFNSIFKQLKGQTSITNPSAGAALTGIGMLGQCEPKAFAEGIKKVIAVVVPGIILDKREHSKTHEDRQFVPRDQLSHEGAVKIAALKLIVRWLCSLKSSEEDSGPKAMKMLLALIETRGDPNMKETINPAERAHLRLVAGNMILKLAQLGEYRPLIQFPHMQALASLLYDEVSEVNCGFLAKLKKSMCSSTPVEFLSLLSFAPLCRPKESGISKRYLMEVNKVAIDIINFRRNLTIQFPEKRGLTFFNPEWSIPYTIYLLSRSPKLKHRGDVRVLEELRECLWVVLDPLINQKKPDGSSSFEYVYQLLQAVKDHRDAHCEKKDAQNQYRAANATLSSSLSSRISLENYHGLFAKCFESGGNTALYIPQELIDHEKRAHGKWGRKGGTKVGVQTKARVNTSKIVNVKTKDRKQRVPVDEIEEDDEEESEEEEEEEQVATSSRSRIAPEKKSPKVVRVSPEKPKTKKAPATPAKNQSLRKPPVKTPTSTSAKQNILKRGNRGQLDSSASSSTRSTPKRGPPTPTSTPNRLTPKIQRGTPNRSSRTDSQSSDSSRNLTTFSKSQSPAKKKLNSSTSVKSKTPPASPARKITSRSNPPKSKPAVVLPSKQTPLRNRKRTISSSSPSKSPKTSGVAQKLKSPQKKTKPNVSASKKGAKSESPPRKGSQVRRMPRRKAKN